MTEGARAYRATIRAEVATVQRHLEKSRETFELAAALDPRFKHLPFCRDSASRERIRAAVVQEVLATLPAPEPAEQDADARPVQRAARNPLRPATGLEDFAVAGRFVPPKPHSEKRWPALRVFLLLPTSILKGLKLS